MAVSVPFADVSGGIEFHAVRFEAGTRDDRRIVAEGLSAGINWLLADMGATGPMGHLFILSVPESAGSDRARGSGMLALNQTDAVQAEVLPIDGLRLVWGVGPPGGSLAVVIDDGGESHETTVVGAAGSRSAFVVPLEAGVIPATVVVKANDGSALGTLEMRPPTSKPGTGLGDSVEVRAVNRQQGSGVVVVEGRVGETNWSLVVSRLGDSLATTLATSSTSGGGAGTSAGPIPTPSAVAQLGVLGLNKSQHFDRLTGRDPNRDVWTLRGWAGPLIERVVLRSASGDTLDLPIGGRSLDLGVGFSAAAVPAQFEIHSLEGFNPAGDLVDRCWLVPRVHQAEALQNR